MKTMRLDTLIAGLNLSLAVGNPATPIIHLADDSRQVKAGTLFVARDPRYIAAAVEAGAAAIVSDQPPIAGLSHLAWVRAVNVDQRLAGRLAERFFGEPASKLKLLAVTGTNGKTTSAFIIQHLLRTAGVACGLIGTVCIDDGRSRQPAELTTPGAIELSSLFAAMVANGCTAAVMETSSHALVQGRTDALRFAAAIFTNLTGDHLDYHATMDEYLAAKKILFDQLDPAATAIVNADDQYSQRIVADCRAKVLTCSLKQTDADCVATVHSYAADSSRVTFRGPWGTTEITLPLPGAHNVMNAMQALTAAHAAVPSVNPEALSRCPGVPGRLERVTSPRNDDPTVLVDYAHTHDALENVLRALRPITRGRLRVLFGCGGDRDRTKRPKMAAVACALADDIVITSDNPRTEQPDDIIREILAGVPGNRPVHVEPDRAKAIACIITAAGAEDVVLLAGKGHEDYQIIGKTKRHFDDREQAAAALAARQRVPS